jgi:hypothetical protein
LAKLRAAATVCCWDVKIDIVGIREDDDDEEIVEAVVAELEHCAGLAIVVVLAVVIVWEVIDGANEFGSLGGGRAGTGGGIKLPATAIGAGAVGKAVDGGADGARAAACWNRFCLFACNKFGVKGGGGADGSAGGTRGAIIVCCVAAKIVVVVAVVCALEVAPLDPVGNSWHVEDECEDDEADDDVVTFWDEAKVDVDVEDDDEVEQADVAEW